MKRPNYPPPLAMFLSVSSSIFFGVPRRSLAHDATQVLNTHTPRPVITGLENLPHKGAFMIVANHHQRENMWIGWVGALLTEAVNSVRPAQTPLRIVVTDAQRMKLRDRDVTMPFSRWFLGRVANFWEMIPIPGDLSDTSGHAAALRTTLSTLREGLPVLFFPEGEGGNAYRLIEALPGTGTFLSIASRRAPILPCSLWEEGENFEQLRGHISPPITFSSAADSAVREQMMVAIGEHLPESMWGTYADAIQKTQGS